MLSFSLLSLIVMLLLIKKIINNQNYWRKKGVVQVHDIVSRFKKGKCSLGESYKNIYDKYKEYSHIGFSLWVNPVLLVKDLGDIQTILEAKFHNFYHRGMNTNPRELLTDNLLFMTDYRRWKLVKQNLSPLFSNVNIKDMLANVDKRINDFIANMPNNECIKRDPFKGVYALSASLVSASLFGLDEESHDFDESPIAKMVWDVSQYSSRNKISIFLSSSYPKLYNFLNLKLFGGYNKWFLDFFKNLCENRRIEKTSRSDFVDLVLKLQKSDIMRDSATDFEMKTSDDIFAAQAFKFYAGGVENTSVLIHFALLELANNKYILERLHKEIDNVFGECNEKFTVYDIEKLEYLDMVFNEVIRKYPAIPLILRKCTTDTDLPSSKTKILKGTRIVIPVFAMHRDEKYFPEPDVFNPERFSKENQSKVVKYSYLPFGAGNRKCIGSRFSTMLIKYTLARILRSFTLTEQKYQPKSFDSSIHNLKNVAARFELISRK